MSRARTRHCTRHTHTRTHGRPIQRHTLQQICCLARTLGSTACDALYLAGSHRTLATFTRRFFFSLSPCLSSLFQHISSHLCCAAPMRRHQAAVNVFFPLAILWRIVSVVSIAPIPNESIESLEERLNLLEYTYTTHTHTICLHGPRCYFVCAVNYHPFND